MLLCPGHDGRCGGARLAVRALGAQQVVDAPAVRRRRLRAVKGAEPPKLMIMPVATITQDNLKEYASLPSGMIVSPSYSEDWVQKNLLTKK